MSDGSKPFLTLRIGRNRFLIGPRDPLADDFFERWARAVFFLVLALAGLLLILGVQQWLGGP